MVTGYNDLGKNWLYSKYLCTPLAKCLLFTLSLWLNYSRYFSPESSWTSFLCWLSISSKNLIFHIRLMMTILSENYFLLVRGFLDGKINRHSGNPTKYLNLTMLRQGIGRKTVGTCALSTWLSSRPMLLILLWLWYTSVKTLIKSRCVGVFVTWSILYVCVFVCVCMRVCVAPQVKYKTSPAIMANVISTCLREERRILSSACMQEQVCHIVSLRGKVPLVL